MTDTPAKAEADQVETHTIEWDGPTVTIPADPDDWDVEVLEYMEQGRGINALKKLIGDRNYEQMKRQWTKDHGRSPKMRDIAPLLEAIAQTYGFESLGE